MKRLSFIRSRQNREQLTTKPMLPVCFLGCYKPCSPMAMSALAQYENIAVSLHQLYICVTSRYRLYIIVRHANNASILVKGCAVMAPLR